MQPTFMTSIPANSSQTDMTNLPKQGKEGEAGTDLCFPDVGL